MAEEDGTELAKKQALEWLREEVAEHAIGRTVLEANRLISRR